MNAFYTLLYRAKTGGKWMISGAIPETFKSLSEAERVAIARATKAGGFEYIIVEAIKRVATATPPVESEFLSSPNS